MTTYPVHPLKQSLVTETVKVVSSPNLPIFRKGHVIHNQYGTELKTLNWLNTNQEIKKPCHISLYTH